ncbi:MAG: hypothetical protein ACI37T_00165 [Candidatus Gastranaerophilaceae bacterium]
MKKRIFILVYIIIFLLGLIFAKTPETDLLKAVLPENASDLVKLSQKYSGTVNVIFEAQNYFDCINLKDSVIAQINTNLIEEDNYQTLLAEYKKYPQNFLSDKNRKLLLDKDYNAVIENSNEALFNPFTVFLLPVEKDPMFLFTDYINELSQKQISYKTELNGKFYSVLTLKSPICKTDIDFLIHLQEKFSTANNRIYLTGSPVHSYFTSQKSAAEINIAALISSFFVIGIIFVYFRNIKVIFPVLLSILLGITAGYSVTASIFRNIHILTFVFSTSLIGICVDYSLHYFVEKKSDKLTKSLKISMITTVTAFLILLFSGIPLLCQIAVFTPVGLITVYYIVTLFYDDLKLDLSKQINLPNFKYNFKILILILLTFFTVFGLARLKFSNDIKLMYKPSPELAQAERILSELNNNNQNKTIILVKGKNIQDILQKEEDIKSNIHSVSLSDFIPSVIRQKENRSLTETLYINKLYDCKFLSYQNIMNLLTQQQENFLIPNFDKFPFLKKFMFDENTSVMIAEGDINISQQNVKCINLPKNISTLLNNSSKVCILLITIAFILLFSYLYYNYQKKAILMLLPPVIGVLCGFAALGFSSVCANIFHIFAVFLVIGFTVDYSVFRFSKIEKSKDAVLISCLTTALSFLLLSFTSFKLISSLGLFLFFGIISAYICSCVLIKNEDNNEVV